METSARAIYLLSPKSVEGVLSLSMISFEIVAKSIDYSWCDTLLFTSKQAVTTADAIDHQWRAFPAISIGQATTLQIEKLGGTVLYQASQFYGKEVAQEIVEHFRDKQILYLRPQKVSFESKKYLALQGINIQEQIIYKTNCIQYPPHQKPTKDAIIIFTAPSTILCFLENFSWDVSYTAVVIGSATQKNLPQNARCVVADEPLIESCIAKAKELRDTLLI